MHAASLEQVKKMRWSFLIKASTFQSWKEDKTQFLVTFVYWEKKKPTIVMDTPCSSHLTPLF